jgi:hypothetical protein
MQTHSVKLMAGEWRSRGRALHTATQLPTPQAPDE